MYCYPRMCSLVPYCLAFLSGLPSSLEPLKCSFHLSSDQCWLRVSEDYLFILSAHPRQMWMSLFHSFNLSTVYLPSLLFTAWGTKTFLPCSALGFDRRGESIWFCPVTKRSIQSIIITVLIIIIYCIHFYNFLCIWVFFLASIMFNSSNKYVKFLAL